MVYLQACDVAPVIEKHFTTVGKCYPYMLIPLLAEYEKDHIAERQALKRKVIRDNPGATGFDLSKTHDGDYRVMKPEERRAAETARGVHRKAMDAVEASKTPKRGVA